MTRPAPDPPAVLVAGLPGSGKSTLGRALAVRLGAVLLDQDTLTNPLMDRLAEALGTGGDFDHPAVTGEVRRARYRCLVDTAADNLDLGRPAVLVAPFTSEVRDPAVYAALAERLAPARTRLVWVAVTPEVATARRAARGWDRDRSATWMSQVRDVPAAPHLLADGTADPRAEADRLADAIGD